MQGESTTGCIISSVLEHKMLIHLCGTSHRGRNWKNILFSAKSIHLQYFCKVCITKKSYQTFYENILHKHCHVKEQCIKNRGRISKDRLPAVCCTLSVHKLILTVINSYQHFQTLLAISFEELPDDEKTMVPSRRTMPHLTQNFLMATLEDVFCGQFIIHGGC